MEGKMNPKHNMYYI